MLSFTAGLMFGCFAGVFGALLFLSFAGAIPDASPLIRKRWPPAWALTGIIVSAMFVATLLYRKISPHRLTFLAIFLLFLVLITARARGLVPSLIALTFAAMVMSYVLPPRDTIIVEGLSNRLLLVTFVLVGIVSSRLVGRRERIL